MKKVISIAVFGEGDRYAQYLPAFVLSHHNLFPKSDGWELRAHLDNTVACSKWGEFLRALEVKGLVRVELMGPAIYTKAMLWRMTPVFDESTDYVFCRDLDAAPLPRDRRACDQFIMSGLSAHTVHDNVVHIGIMGGLCGFRSPEFRRQAVLRSLDDLYAFAAETDEAWSKHGTDQNVLNRLIANRPAIQLLEHRYAGWKDGQPGRTARGAGSYGCQSWSTMLPDIGLAPMLDETLISRADSLANHLGSAGYDHEAAIAFWEEHGCDRTANTVRECSEVLR